MKNRNRLFTWTLVCLAWLLISSTSAMKIDNSSEKVSEKIEWVNDQPEERGSASITFESQASGNLNENESPKSASTVLYTQNFDNEGNMPSGWTTYSEGPDFYPWQMEADYVPDYRAWCTSYAAGPEKDITEQLYMTDYIDCSGYTSLELEFYMLYKTYDGDEYAEVRYATSETYPSFYIAHRWYSEDVEGTQIFDLSYAAGDPEVRIAFRYHGTYDYYMIVDDVILRGEEHSILIDVSHSPLMSPSNQFFASFYSYIDTVAHRNVGLEITESLLDNFDALIIPNSQEIYSLDEKIAMANYKIDGGRIFVIGERGSAMGSGVDDFLAYEIYIYADDLTDNDDNNNGNFCQVFFDTSNFGSHEIMNGIYDIYYPAGAAFTYTGWNTYNLITSDDDGTANPSNSPVFTVRTTFSGDLLILLDSNLWWDHYTTIGLEDMWVKDYGDNWQLLLNIVDWLSDTGSGSGDNDNDDDDGNGSYKEGHTHDSPMDYQLPTIGLIAVGSITAALVAIVIVVWVVKKKHLR